MKELNNEHDISTRLEEGKQEAFYGSYPDLEWEERFRNINILAIAMVRGSIPETALFKVMCGHPNCTRWFNTNTEKIQHWRTEHTDDESYKETWVTNILNVIGVNMTIRRRKILNNETQIISHPMIQCPICRHISANSVAFENHSKSHRSSYGDTDKMSKFYKYQYMFLNKFADGFTLNNVFKEGEYIGCKWCAFGAIRPSGLRIHAATAHKDHQEDETPPDSYEYYYEYETRQNIHIIPITGAGRNDPANPIQVIVSVEHEGEDIINNQNVQNEHPQNINNNNIDNIQINNVNIEQNIVHTHMSLQDNNTNEEHTHDSDNIHQHLSDDDNIESDDDQQLNIENDDSDHVLDTPVSYMQDSSDQNDQIINDVSTHDTDHIPHSTSTSTNTPTNDNNENITISEGDIRQGIRWHREYFRLETSIPRITTKNKLKIKEAIRIALEDKAIPLLENIQNVNIPENVQYEVVNGYMCYSFHIIVEEVCKALGINGHRRTVIEQRVEDRDNEIELSLRITSKQAGERIARHIRRITRFLSDDTLSDQIKHNCIQREKNTIMQEAQHISVQMRDHVFEAGIIDDHSIDAIINDIERRDVILRYLESDEDERIAACEERRKKEMSRKVQSLYRLSPKRAMSYYINKKPSPSCKIPIRDIARELGQRWNRETGFTPAQDNSTWYSRHHLQEEDKAYIIEYMQDKDNFKEVIKTRDPTSAHGPDGIGYWALQADVDLGARYMTLLSKLILKYEFMPSTWNESRSILLYKKGNPEDLSNWRPLTIAPCLYRTWTCTLSNALQAINRRCTRLFNENQKGFIRGIDGCLEHSRIAAEVLNDANRERKSVYIMAIDLRDAFGSVPHQLIHQILNEMNFPSNIKNIIKDTYDGGYTKIRIGNEESTRIKIGQGVKQGCPLSPTIFNLCINPLLNTLQSNGEGYRVRDIKVGVQAYADDVLLFSENREGMERNIQILEAFIRYAKLEVNVNKCKSMSYIINDQGHRDFDNDPFLIYGQPVPTTTLAEGVEYLGTTTAATNHVREHGTTEIIKEVKQVIDNISKSYLTLPQKAHAIKTFATPMLDYALTEGKVKLSTMQSIDKQIREVIKSHINSNLPNEVFYTHWKDGGFSFAPLEERMYSLRIKAFIALYNSHNMKTKALMREFVESERRFRQVQTRIIGNNNEDDDKIFLDWKIRNTLRKGTDTISILALRAADHYQSTIKTIDGCACLIIHNSNNDNVNNNNQNQNNEENNEGNVDNQTNNESNEDEDPIAEPKKITRTLMKAIRKNKREELINRTYVGHSFRNIKNAPYANSMYSNYKSTLNDNIASFVIKARTNMLVTGSIAIRRESNTNNVNNNENIPSCPYCRTVTSDSIAHRLNRCQYNRYEKKKRHNMIQNVILRDVQRKFGQANVTIDSGVSINGTRVDAPYSSLKPDIVAWDNDNIHIIEFSCPYDMIKEDGSDTMTTTYNEKKEKYHDLVEHCREKFNMNVHLHIIIVSSLGAIHKKSINDIESLYSQSRKSKIVKTVLRRMSTLACIGSYFIFYRIPFQENDEHDGVIDTDNDSAEESNNNNNNQGGNNQNDNNDQQEEEEDYLELLYYRPNGIDDDMNDEDNNTEDDEDDDVIGSPFEESEASSSYEYSNDAQESNEEANENREENAQNNDTNSYNEEYIYENNNAEDEDTESEGNEEDTAEDTEENNDEKVTDEDNNDDQIESKKDDSDTLEDTQGPEDTLDTNIEQINTQARDDNINNA